MSKIFLIVRCKHYHDFLKFDNSWGIYNLFDVKKVIIRNFPDHKENKWLYLVVNKIGITYLEKERYVTNLKCKVFDLCLQVSFDFAFLSHVLDKEEPYEIINY